MDIQIKRGLANNIPTLLEGEPAITTDTGKLYVGEFLINPDGTAVSWNDVTGKPETFIPSEHNHDDRYYTETEVDTKLSGKSDTTHSHTGSYEPVIVTKKAAFNMDFGTSTGTVCQGDDSRLSDSRNPTAHTHDDRYYTEAETTAAISAAINLLINGSPGALDTLNELATAMGNDPNFASTITNALAGKVDKVTGKQLSSEDFTTTLLNKLNNITGTNTGDETASTIKTKLGISTLSGSNTGDQNLASFGLTATATELNYTAGITSAIQGQLDTKAPLNSPALTGNPTAPTPATDDNDTSIATTAFVKSQGYITSSGSGAKITTASVEPATPSAGEFWYKIL
ncbi:MAG: hypothetical protein HY818_05475 [Acetobacterium woodii]|nr:hypothetical protein [Acetobacterium woodii]